MPILACNYVPQEEIKVRKCDECLSPEEILNILDSWTQKLEIQKKEDKKDESVNLCDQRLNS
nr:MAG: hypothetical protein [Microviridae sp.]